MSGGQFTAVPAWTPVRVPAFWMLLVVNLVIALVVVAVLAISAFYIPRSSALAIPLVVAYGAGWLALVLRPVDPVEQRPAWVVGAAVGWGATVACAVGVGAGLYLDNVVAKAVSPTFAARWGAALVAPTVEETAKAAGVVLLLLAARPYLSTVWSGAVYGALVGVGFTATEDAGYAVMFADLALPDDVTAAGQLLLLRFSTPGIVGHPLFTAVAGAGIAYAWLRTDRSAGRRLAVLGGAFATSWTMHFMVNSPLAAGAAKLASTFGGAAGWAGYVLATLVPAVPALFWLAAVRRADTRLLLDRASAALPAVLPAGEVPALCERRARARADLQARRAGGRNAVRGVRRLRRAQLRLAGALARPYRGLPPVGPDWLAPPVHRWCREALAARAELADRRAPAEVSGGVPG